MIKLEVKKDKVVFKDENFGKENVHVHCLCLPYLYIEICD